MSWEDELRSLARERESVYESSSPLFMVDRPGTLRRQLRHYLAEQANSGKLKRTYDHVPRLDTHEAGLQELVCEEVEFPSDSMLSFNIRMEQKQAGWLVRDFEFRLHLTKRAINMLQIHLNEKVSHDPLRVPRCHFHIGDSDAHIPFPIMNPRLIVHLICEHIEPDLGL